MKVVLDKVKEMYKVFGTKENVEYVDRICVYLIPVRNNQVGVIETSKGYFFIGGGLNGDENHYECIKRECLEETGYLPYIKHKVCSAEEYTIHPTIEYFHPIQTYYVGDLIEKITFSTEVDHKLVWIDYDYLRGKMFVEMQNWALEQAIKIILNNK